MDFYKQVIWSPFPNGATADLWTNHFRLIQRRFNDQITGHSGLTFFEAFNSEVGLCFADI